MTEINCRFWKF